MAQLFQNDARWANTKIGLQNNLTISQVGCLLTSMTMVVNHYGASETPASLNERMKASNGFNGAWIKSAQVPSQFSSLGVKRQKWIQCENSAAPMALIDQALAGGSLIVARVDWNADPGIQGHWVVIHKKSGNDYSIWDPWKKDGAPNKLTQRYKFTGTKPEDVILEAIIHGKGELGASSGGSTSSSSSSSSSTARKTTPASSQSKVSTRPSSSGTVAVKPTVNQLSLRQKAVSGTVIQMLKSSDVLTVIESGGKAKIGKKDQWLRVRSQSGKEGYLAAWLVKETAAPAKKPAGSPSSSSSAPARSSLKVKTTAQVSFRSAPRVANDTLIAYIPQNSVLTIAESGNAVAKIGVQNQWLKVRTNTGKTGYVAAWYVKKA